MIRRTIGSVWLYFLLTIALGIPFWVLGAATGRQLLPALPISALGVVCMVGAAAILSGREDGWRGVANLLRKSFDFGRARSAVWYAPAVLLPPLVSLAAYGIMRATGTPLPVPHLAAGKTVGLFFAFLIAALCEELGWSGYAIDPPQERYGALRASLIVGAVWAAWHFIPLAEAHRSLPFVAWWTLGTISLRVIIVWLYNNTGKSVFVAALFHAMTNLTWQLFPVDGSFYDPRVMSPILALVAVAVTVAWGPGTLARRSR